jgi:hypothetical protein
LPFKFNSSDFDFDNKDALRRTRQHFLELEDSMKPRLRSSVLLKDFAASTYVSRIVSHSGTARDVMWLGFAHKKFGDPRTAIQFQYGTNDTGSGFFGMWIQGDGASRKARIAAHDSLRRFATVDALRRFNSLGRGAYLWCWAKKTARYPKFRIDQYVTDLTEDDMEDLLWSLKKRRLWVDIGWHLSKTSLLKLRNVEGEIVKRTQMLLPIYNILAGLGVAPKGTAPVTQSKRPRPGPLDEEQKELERLSIPSRSEVISEVRRRVGQELVRKEAEMNYPSGCAMCEPTIALGGLLVASHIKRWADSNKRERYDGANVLRLCVMHDELFERGYMAVDEDMNLLYSSKLSDAATFRFLQSSTREKIGDWQRTPPGRDYLEKHKLRHIDMKPFLPISQLRSDHARPNSNAPAEPVV